MGELTSQVEKNMGHLTSQVEKNSHYKLIATQSAIG